MSQNAMGDIPLAIKEKLEKMTTLLKSAQTAIATLKTDNERLKKENEALQDRVQELEKEKLSWKKSESKSPPPVGPIISPRTAMKKAPLEQKTKASIADSMMSTGIGGIALNIPIEAIPAPVEPVRLPPSVPEKQKVTQKATPKTGIKEEKAINKVLVSNELQVPAEKKKSDVKPPATAITTPSSLRIPTPPSVPATVVATPVITRKRKKFTGNEPLLKFDPKDSESQKVMKLLQQVSELNYRSVAKALTTYPSQLVKREFISFMQSNLIPIEERNAWIQQVKLLIKRKSTKAIPNISPALQSKLTAVIKMIVSLMAQPESHSSQQFGQELLSRLYSSIIASCRNQFGVAYQWEPLLLGWKQMDVSRVLSGLKELLPQRAFFQSTTSSSPNTESATTQNETEERVEEVIERPELVFSDSDFDSEDDQDDPNLEDIVGTTLSAQNEKGDDDQMDLVDSDDEDDFESFEMLLQQRLKGEIQVEHVAPPSPTLTPAVERSTTPTDEFEGKQEPSKQFAIQLDEILLAREFSDFCVSYVFLFARFHLEAIPGIAKSALATFLDEFHSSLYLPTMIGLTSAVLHLLRDYSLLHASNNSYWRDFMASWLRRGSFIADKLSSPLSTSNGSALHTLQDKLKEHMVYTMGALRYEAEKVISAEEAQQCCGSTAFSAADLLHQPRPAGLHYTSHNIDNINLTIQTHGIVSMLQEWMRFPLLDGDASARSKLQSVGHILGMKQCGEIANNLLLGYAMFAKKHVVRDYFNCNASQKVNLALTSLLDEDILQMLEDVSGERYHVDFDNLRQETDLIDVLTRRWTDLLSFGNNGAIARSRAMMSLDDLLDEFGTVPSEEHTDSENCTASILNTVHDVLSATQLYLIQPILRYYDERNHGWRGGNSGEGLRLTVVVSTRVAVMRDLLIRMAFQAKAPAVLRLKDVIPLDYLEAFPAVFFFQFSTIPVEDAVELCYLLHYVQEEIVSKPDRLQALLYYQTSEDEINPDSLILLEKVLHMCQELLHLVTMSCFERFMYVYACQLRAVLKVVTANMPSIKDAELSKCCWDLVHDVSSQLISLPTPWGPSNRNPLQQELHSVMQACSTVQSIPRHMLAFFREERTKLPAFLINLDRRADRFRKCVYQADIAKLNLIRISAIDGKDANYKEPGMAGLLRGAAPETTSTSIAPSTWLAKISPRDIANQWNTSLNYLFDKNCPNNVTVTLTSSEKACAASHLKCWRYINSLHELHQSVYKKEITKLTTIPKDKTLFQEDEFKFAHEAWKQYFEFYGGSMQLAQSLTAAIAGSTMASAAQYDDFYLILEDDIHIKSYLLPHFRDEIHKVIQRAKSLDWDILYLGAALPSTSSKFKYSLLKSGYFMKVNYAWMLHGYILRGKSASKLLSKLPIVGPVDNFIAQLIYDNEINAIVLGDYIVEQGGGKMNTRLNDSNIVRSQSSVNPSSQWMDTSTHRFQDQRREKLSMKKKLKQRRTKK